MTYPTSPAISAPDSAGGAGKSVAAFLSGLVGLAVANLLLGPLAITLGVMALRDDTPRRGRAAVGIALGVADLVVFTALALHSGAGTGHPTWRFSSF